MSPLKKTQKENQKQIAKQQADIEKYKTSISATVKERNDTEARLNRTKPLDELEERYETLKRENEEDQRVRDDENASPSEKQAAADRIAEREEEMERLAPQIQHREEALPLRKRVKNIFKNMAGHCKRLF